MQKKIVVLAFKFNDIFYASSTDEFQGGTKKTLLILADKIPRDKYPGLERFDDVYYYRVSVNRLAQIFLAMRIVKDHKRELWGAILIVSNPYIVLTQIIMIFGRVSEGVMIEDGVMNYYANGGGSSKRKLIQYNLLKIFNFWKYFNFTYLIYPEKALTYIGEPRRLALNKEVESEGSLILYSFLKDKSILIGGGAIEFLDNCDKERIVASLGKQLSLDYYIPHHSDRVGACGLNVLDLNSEKLTLEMIYPYCSGLKVYSFGSSAAFNARGINEAIDVIYLRLIDIKGMNDNFDRFMMKNHEKILEVNVEGKVIGLL